MAQVKKPERTERTSHATMMPVRRESHDVAGSKIGTQNGTLACGNMDLNLRSNSWWFSFDPYPCDPALGLPCPRPVCSGMRHKNNCLQYKPRLAPFPWHASSTWPVLPHQCGPRRGVKMLQGPKNLAAHSSCKSSCINPSMHFPSGLAKQVSTCYLPLVVFPKSSKCKNTGSERNRATLLTSLWMQVGTTFNSICRL